MWQICASLGFIGLTEMGAQDESTRAKAIRRIPWISLLSSRWLKCAFYILRFTDHSTCIKITNAHWVTVPPTCLNVPHEKRKHFFYYILAELCGCGFGILTIKDPWNKRYFKCCVKFRIYPKMLVENMLINVSTSVVIHLFIALIIFLFTHSHILWNRFFHSLLY